MFTIFRRLTGVAIITSLIFASSSTLASGSTLYRVTIANITNSIIFTPILVASHRKKLPIFELGEPASDSLATIAESGNPMPLAEMLQAIGAGDVGNSGAPLFPGASIDVMVSAEHSARRITVASMLLPTNDGFIALNSVKAPKHGSVTYYSSGYDASSEVNDDDCANIPGPTCGGTGLSAAADTDEGFVYIHRGIQGVVTGLLEGFENAVYDWRNPVAKITITRIRGYGNDGDDEEDDN